jgi:hypothetical protein
MAKAIKRYKNGLSIRFLKKPNKYFITFGVDHIKIEGEYNSGFKTFDEAEKYLLTLTPKPYTNYDWSVFG